MNTVIWELHHTVEMFLNNNVLEHLRNNCFVSPVGYKVNIKFNTLKFNR